MHQNFFVTRPDQRCIFSLTSLPDKSPFLQLWQLCHEAHYPLAASKWQEKNRYALESTKSSQPHLGPNLVEFVVVSIGKMLPHIVVSLETSVVFAISGLTMEAIPDVSVAIRCSHTVWSNYKR